MVTKLKAIEFFFGLEFLSNLHQKLKAQLKTERGTSLSECSCLRVHISVHMQPTNVRGYTIGLQTTH